MPIYEYVCNKCNKRLNFLVLKISDFSPKCNKCKSSDLKRIMSRFSSVQSEEQRLEKLSDPSKWGDLNENDPKSMVKMMKKMGKELGEEVGDDYNQMIEEAELEASKAEENKRNSEEELI